MIQEEVKAWDEFRASLNRYMDSAAPRTKPQIGEIRSAAKIEAVMSKLSDSVDLERLIE